MDEFENSLIADFISEHWQLFLHFYKQRGVDEAAAEAIYQKLTEE